MKDGIIQIEIPNLKKVMAAFSRSPEITQQEMQGVISMVPDILAKYTTPDTVPYRTGLLVQTFQRDVSHFMARWFPTRNYAPFVEFGTRFMKANPYMERIAGKAKGEIDDAFANALDRVAERVANESK